MGFDIERFIDSVDEELICPICESVLENPLQIIECEHVFCSDCITKWIQTGNQTCPCDRKTIQKEHLRPPRFIIKFLEKLQIKCDFASQGCVSTVKLEHLSQHCRQCKFNQNNKATNSNSGMSVRKKEFVNHNYDEELKLALEMSKLTFENEQKQTSQLMGNAKKMCDIYMANSMKQLNEKASSVISDTKTLNLLSASSILLRLFDIGKKALEEGDQERAYISYFRYCDLYLKFTKTSQYKDDIVYANKIIPLERCQTLIKEVENLQSSLTIRYQEKNSKFPNTNK